FFSSHTFWQAVLYRSLGSAYGSYDAYQTLSGSKPGEMGWSLPAKNLVKLPKFQALQLKTMNYIYSHAWSYWPYYRFKEYTDFKFQFIRLVKFFAEKPARAFKDYLDSLKP